MNNVCTKGVGVVVAWAMLGFLLVGCGRPQASSFENQQLIGSLRTAVSARNSQWLEDNVKVLEERRAAGKVADAEYEVFQGIIASAKQGRWEAAEREVIKFLKAQRPTQEQVERATKQLRSESTP
jgi:hypothetical protein